MLRVVESACVRVAPIGANRLYNGCENYADAQQSLIAIHYRKEKQ